MARDTFTAREHPETRAIRLNLLKARLDALELRQAAFLPDSTAADVATLKADYNALLAALRDAGLMLPEE